MQAIYAIIGKTTTSESGQRKSGKKRVPVYTLHNDKRVSNFAAAYIMEESKRATFRALKTIYQKSGSAVIYKLMQENAALLGQDRNDFENWAQNTYGTATMTAKKHNRQRDALTGKMIECREYVTFEETETGKIINDAEKSGAFDAYNLDINDLINTACLAFLELVEIGAIIDYRDIKLNRGYVYTAINREIYASKKAINENELFSKYCIITDKDGNETLYTGKHIDKYAKVDYDITLKTISDCVKRIAAKQANTEKAVQAFELFAAGMTKTEIAHAMDINEKQVRRYIELVRRIADNAETRQALSELIG